MSISEIVFFNVKLPDSSLSELFPITYAIAVSGASAAIVGAGLLVYFKKYRH